MTDKLLQKYQFTAAASLLALIVLCVSWELWLAPLRPGGSWLVLKAVPLLLPLRGVLQGRIYTLQWTTLLVLAYFAEGLVRATSDLDAGRWLGLIEIFLTIVLFASAILAIRRAQTLAAR